jgi:hypothetical protein
MVDLAVANLDWNLANEARRRHPNTNFANPDAIAQLEPNTKGVLKKIFWDFRNGKVEQVIFQPLLLQGQALYDVERGIGQFVLQEELRRGAGAAIGEGMRQFQRTSALSYTPSLTEQGADPHPGSNVYNMKSGRGGRGGDGPMMG